MATNRKAKEELYSEEDLIDKDKVHHNPEDEDTPLDYVPTIDAQENLGGNIGFRASVDRNAFNMLNALCEETGLTRNECVELALYTLFSAQKAQVETRFRAMMDARTNAVLSKWE